MHSQPLRSVSSRRRLPRGRLAAALAAATGRAACIVALLLSNASASAAQDGWAAAVLQQSKVRATDPADNSFGQAVAIDGDTAVIGIQAGVFSVPEGEPIGTGGAAYVFKWNGTAWVAQARLQPADGVARKSFGTSVAISGDTIVVGAYADSTRKLQAGSAYVFVGSGSSWAQTAKLEALDSTERDNFGWSVAIDGDDILVGAPGHDLPGRSNAGAVYMFRGAGPSQGTKVTAPTDFALGRDLDADQGTFIAGTSTRPAYIYRVVGGTLTQVARLVPTTGNGGGGGVAVHGTTALVGSPTETIGTSGFRQGAAYLFTEQGGAWSQAARLTASDGVAGDEFGHDVALCSGGQALVGVPSHNVGTTAVKEGAAYAFDQGPGGWRSSQTQDELIVAPDAGLGEREDFTGFTWEAFGWSVSCSGNTLLVSAYSDTDDTGTRAGAGAAYFLTRAVDPTPVPTNLTVLVNQTNVRFSWTAPAEPVASYLLEVGFTSGATSIPPIDLGGRTVVDFEGVPNGRYYGRVRARMADGTVSGPSNEVVITVPGFCRRAAPPANFTATATGGVATLAWDPVPGATQYVIEVGTASEGGDLLIAVPPSSTGFTAAAPAGLYFLRVRATTFCGQTSPSRERRLRVGGAGPSPITVDDAATTPSNEEVVIPVLANDRISLGGRLSIVSVVQPANGMADANPDGTITYEAADGFVGREEFTYTVEDEAGGLDSGTVVVDVLPASDADTLVAADLPVAADTRPIEHVVGNMICYWADEYETQIRIGGYAYMKEIGDSRVNQFRMNFKVYKPDVIKTGADFWKVFQSDVFPSDAQSFSWQYGGEVGAPAGYNLKVMVKMTWVRAGRRDFNQTRLIGRCDAR
jgi:hypothetical protein